MTKPVFFITALALLSIVYYLQQAPTPLPQLIEAERQITAEADSIATLPVEAELAGSAAAPESPDTAVPERSVEIGGRVADESGNGLGGVIIEIVNLGFDGAEIETRRTTSNHRGEFRLSELTAGRQYSLEIEPAGEHAGFLLDAFTPEQADALSEILLHRIDRVDVDGMIVDTDSAPVANFELSVRSLTAVFPDQLIRSDSSGYFKLRDFPAGEIRIATNSSDYYRIKGLKLAPDEYRNLTLIIDRGSYLLSGWVSDANGTPLAEARVTVKSAFATDHYHSYSYRSKTTDASGRFEFADLGGHALTLGVYASGFKTHIQRHEFKSFSDLLEIRLGTKP